jgi:hypothetical protein
MNTNLLCAILLILTTQTFAQSLRRLDTPAKTDKEHDFYLERFYYEDFIYSQGKKTQLGDQVELDASLIYRYDENTYARLRFETTPEENRFDNKTSSFEFLAGYKRGQIEFAFDFSFETNDVADDGNSSGMSLGFDVDSEYTMLKWNISKHFSFTFFPFNFDGEVGQEFNTRDVTRLYYIEGAPTTITFSQGTNKVVEKTIPGFQLDFKAKGFKAYVGVGAATYLSPSNEDFDLRTNPTAVRWERKSDLGYKFGASHKSKGSHLFRAEAVGHTESKETGALLESAISLYAVKRFNLDSMNLILEFEGTGTKAGKEAWRVSRTDKWFERTTSPGFDPVYADLNRNQQDWLGETGYGLSFRAGLEFVDNKTLYAFTRYQSEHFIFRDEESANTLRTADESLSHGGLARVGSGIVLRYGNFSVIPEIEYRKAKNPVFSNSADVVGAQRLLARFRKTDVLLTMFLNYEFGGSKILNP